MKLQLKDIKKNIIQNIEKIQYNYAEAAPWMKIYEKEGLPSSLVYPECTIYGLLKKSALQNPNNFAYEYFGKKVTYEEFLAKIKRCAMSLQKIGVTANDTVTILMPNTPEAITMFYACNMIGAVANMVHPLSSESEIEFCINQAKSTYILAMDALYDKLYAIKDKVKLNKIILAPVSISMPTVTTALFWLTKGRKIKIENAFTDNVIKWKDFIYEGHDIKDLKRSPKTDQDLAVILYSGGTTGKSKGIMHNSRTFNATALMHHTICVGAKPGNSILCILPIFHGFGLGICFHTAMTIGMKCIIIPKFTPGEFGKLIKTYKPNMIAGVPTLYEAFLQTEISEDGLSFLDTVLCGGDTLNPDLQKKINRFLKEHSSPATVRIGYGMTESVASVTASSITMPLPGSIGIPSPDNYIKIVKPGTTENLYYDEDGEICICGPTVMMGYLDEPEETANTLKVHKDGKTWLHTGDMGSMNKDGIIFFKSRIKRMIISSGYNVYPNQIENVINSHPKVLTSIVVGVPHPYKGEVAKAYVVLKPEFKQSEEIDNELKEHYKKNLAKYMWPTGVEYRETLPQTKIGKADYRNVK